MSYKVSWPRRLIDTDVELIGFLKRIYVLHLKVFVIFVHVPFSKNACLIGRLVLCIKCMCTRLLQVEALFFLSRELYFQK